jgi:hypothetical protein
MDGLAGAGAGAAQIECMDGRHVAHAGVGKPHD